MKLPHSLSPQGSSCKKPVVLCVLDGWGIGQSFKSPMPGVVLPTWEGLIQQWPTSSLKASGPDVGLPVGQVGNSEVGHAIIGAGRIPLQDLTRVDNALEKGVFWENPSWIAMTTHLLQQKKACHVMALLSDGGVHSHLRHIQDFLKKMGSMGLKVWIHGFLDGRDTLDGHGLEAVHELNNVVQSYPHFLRWASLGGRYFGMDRDNRWDRTRKAYDAIVSPQLFQESPFAVEHFYKKGFGDEMIPPFSLQGYKGVEPQDALLVLNFRCDRISQITTALLDPKFASFPVKNLLWSSAISLKDISKAHQCWVAPLLNRPPLDQGLPSILSQQGKRQLRIAETEKYDHVTCFFNGGREAPFPKEDRILIPSPPVATYDLCPRMSAHELTARIVEEIAQSTYDFILINYANADMVGHTGNIEACATALHTLDRCLRVLSEAVLSEKGLLLITADHGNIEGMVHPQTGRPNPTHTYNPVPFVLVGQTTPLRCHGALADVAPTVCQLMGFQIPPEMTGASLLINT